MSGDFELITYVNWFSGFKKFTFLLKSLKLFGSKLARGVRSPRHHWSNFFLAVYSEHSFTAIHIQAFKLTGNHFKNNSWIHDFQVWKNQAKIQHWICFVYVSSTYLPTKLSSTVVYDGTYHRRQFRIHSPNYTKSKSSERMSFQLYRSIMGHTILETLSFCLALDSAPIRQKTDSLTETKPLNIIGREQLGPSIAGFHDFRR